MLDEKGYTRPTYDDLLDAQIARAKELFGDDIDTSELTPLGKYIRLNVYDLAEAYEVSEKIYYSRFPNTAEGTSLDRLMPFAGISRNVATPARHKVKITGTAGETVEVGFLVDTNDGVTFYLIQDTVIGAEGTVEAIFECETAGEIGNVPVGAIVNIVNPDANVDSITHISIDTDGRDEESDAELRERFSLAIAGSGSGTINAIRGAIMRINGVYGCVIKANETNETDSGGRPAHSFECYVQADSSLNQLIAEAIFSKKPVGIKTYGTTSVTVKDEAGEDHTVSFSVASDVEVGVKVTIKTNNYYPSNGADLIKANLEDYINSLTNGESVIRTALYEKIYAVEGVVEVTSLTISISGGAYSEQNVVCTPAQAPRTDTGSIEVTVAT